MIESDIIYNFEDFRILVSEKTKEGAYYLLYDDFYFEQIEKNMTIIREAYTVAVRYTKSINILKYINFKIKNNFTMKELFKFVKSLNKYTKILLTIYNPKNKECFLLFISNKDDLLLEKEINKLIEMEI